MIQLNKQTGMLSNLLLTVALIAIGVTLCSSLPSSTEEKAVPAGTKARAVDYRLPTALKPIHYDIRIQAFITGNFSTKGHVDMTFECLEETNQVIYHILDIITDNDTIKLVPSSDPNGAGLAFESHAYDPETQFYIGTLVDPLVVGETYIYSLDYTGYLNDINAGFYRSSYLENDETVLLATTQFEATDARRAFPCFDEPALKATYNITIGRQDGFGVISNMPNISSTPIAGQPGWYWENFDTTLPMSSYLTAFIVSDFVSINSNENDHVLFRVWAREEAIAQAEYARDIGPGVLTYYEEYFNIPFPLPKQDMAALPDFAAGAMENWGLVTYRETALLFDPAVSGASSKQRVCVVIAHELAHQWFGDLVSPAWWSEVWLNEGFATYMEFLGCNAVEPDFGMMEQFITEDVQYVFRIDALESSHPINNPVNTPDEISQVFDGISYSKGGTVLRMMNFFLTEPSFRQGLTNYLNSLSYTAATQDDLWFYLTEQAHADGTLDASLTVKQIMDTWTLQMGYPVITITRDTAGNADITQERFLLLKNPNSTDTHNYMWWVPLSFATEDNPDFTQTGVKRWISDTESSVTVSGLPTSGWLIANVQQTAYYRVNYDLDNWNAIISQLLADHTVIHLQNRAQLIDDSMNLARGGVLAYETALDVASYLTAETELVPWYSAMDNFAYLDSMFARASGFGSMTNYLLSLSTPLYESLGFDDSLTDPHVEQLLRSSILSTTCDLEYTSCLSNATAFFNVWMANPDDETIISPNIKSTVYCYGIAQGTETEWDFAWNQYLKSNNAAEKSRILSALGCSREPWILERYLEWGHTDGSGIKKQDAYYTFNSVAGNVYGRDIAWRFLQTNWDAIGAYMGTYSECADYTYTVTSSFNTDTDYQELLQLKADHYSTLGTATREFDQAVERVNNNIEWMSANYQVINQWLIDHGYSSSQLRENRKSLRPIGRF